MGFLEKILPDIKKTLSSNYYEHSAWEERERKSLVEAIENARDENRTPIIAELKPRSPSSGELFLGDAVKLGEEFRKAGATGLSILTEPVHFGGDIRLLSHEWKIPVLMKDFVIDEKQIGSGDAVLLILKLLDMCGLDESEFIETAHEKEMEVVLEVHSLEEFRRAKKTEADIIGINNRDLETLSVDLNTTLEILKKEKSDRIILSESGINTKEEIRKMLDAGASAVLIGASLLKEKNPAQKLRELL